MKRLESIKVTSGSGVNIPNEIAEIRNSVELDNPIPAHLFFKAFLEYPLYFDIKLNERHKKDILSKLFSSN